MPNCRSYPQSLASEVALDGSWNDPSAEKQAATHDPLMARSGDSEFMIEVASLAD
jgi:hypothetical protein